MVKVHFNKDYDFVVDSLMTIAYTAGTECEVDEDCAARAVATKAATYSAIAEDDLIEGGEDE